MRLRWFGHSAFRVETGSSVILIDPFLSMNPKWNGTLEEASAGATHVVLTHGHDDHIGDTVEICAATGAVLVACFEVGSYLASRGVTRLSPGNHGGEQRFDDFSVAFVPAWHSSSTRDADGRTIYLGNPAGVVITPSDGGGPLYHMGDTAIFSDMALVHEIYRPRVGIVPIGDRFTMGPEQAALACRKFFRFELAIPCHYATFPFLEPTADRFVAAMGAGKVAVPEPGGWLDL